MEHSPSPAEFNHHDFSSINFASDYASALAGYPAYEIHNMCKQCFHFLAMPRGAVPPWLPRGVSLPSLYSQSTELATDYISIPLSYTRLPALSTVPVVMCFFFALPSS